MGNNDFNNDYLKLLGDTVLNNEWMTNLYGAQRVDQQAELKRLFTQVADNNVTASEKDALIARAETIQERVERLEAKMAVLAEALEKNQAEINRQAKAITDLVAKAEDQANELEDAQIAAVKRATEDVFYYLQKGDIGADAVVPEIRKRISGDPAFKICDGKLQSTLAKLDNKEAEVANIVAEADKWIAQRNILEAQYGATKSTYDLLQATIARIGNNSKSYTNSDFNTNVPIYSPEKIAIISKFSENANINVAAGPNIDYVEGSQPPNLLGMDAINEKYKDLLGTEATGSDRNSYNNKAVQNLGKALNMGLIEDLCAAGLSVGAAQDFIAENFKGANIQRTGSGLSIPYGHGDQAKAVFEKLTKKIKNYRSGFEGVKNTWDQEGGNRIDSNKQIASLADNYENIIGTMAAAGFTFKEAMYAMFDSKLGIFKDSGVVYNTGDQGEEPNYYINFAGDEKTAKMYQGLADTIYKTWGVKPLGGVDVGRFDEEEAKISRTDPLSFDLGDKNNQFTFIIDRNNDGAFGDSSEFLGGTGNWLEDLRSFDVDGNGVIEGDELEKLMILNTRFEDDADQGIDNNTYEPGKTGSDKEFERESTTNVHYQLTNAAELGITSINLNDLDENDVNIGKDDPKYDANGSQIFGDSFTFTMQDGTEVTATRKDETKEYMESVYGGVYGKATKLGFSEEYVQEVMNEDYGEFDAFDAKYSPVFENINILKNVGQIANEAQQMRDDTIKEIKEYENIELIKAGNKAAAYKNVNTWPSIRNSVMSLVRAEGLPENEEQLEGIHVLSGSHSAREIVEIYKEQLQRENDNTNERQINREAWKALVKVTQAGIAATADEIKELLRTGQAKNADDVLRILSEIPQGVEVETDVTVLEFDSEREQEIFEAFNRVFNEAGYSDKVVDALEILCKKEMANKNYMLNKSGEQLAQDIMKEMGLN